MAGQVIFQRIQLLTQWKQSIKYYQTTWVMCVQWEGTNKWSPVERKSEKRQPLQLWIKSMHIGRVCMVTVYLKTYLLWSQIDLINNTRWNMFSWKFSKNIISISNKTAMTCLQHKLLPDVNFICWWFSEFTYVFIWCILEVENLLEKGFLKI